MSICEKCNGTGMADSGGVQPWGDQILIECDCTINGGNMESKSREQSLREQFQKWWEEWFGDAPLTPWDELWHGDGYTAESIDIMWDAWQASREALVVELPEPCSPGDFCMDIPVQAHHEVIESIRAAGITVK